MHHNLAYFPYLFAGMAAFFLIIGIRVTIANRPLFLSARYFFIFMLFAILPQAINMTYTYAVSNNLPSKLSPVMLMNPIILICLLVFFWFQMKGYIAIGVTDESFRSALHFSLNKNNLVFEEQLSTIKLISENASIQVAIQPWGGSGQIKIKNSKNKNLLPRIISGVNEFYINNNTTPNRITSSLFIIMGVFMLISSICFFYA